uniref:Uncharacterized protein n=1 Tax=Glossina austeni TaxID=7395 RepID=A0A1A9VTZ7_GLOAU
MATGVVSILYTPGLFGFLLRLPKELLPPPTPPVASFIKFVEAKLLRLIGLAKWLISSVDEKLLYYRPNIYVLIVFGIFFGRFHFAIIQYLICDAREKIYSQSFNLLHQPSKADEGWERIEYQLYEQKAPGQRYILSQQTGNH